MRLDLGTANGNSVAESASMPPEGICLSGVMHNLFATAEAAGTPVGGTMTWAPSRASAVTEYRQLGNMRAARLGNKQQSGARHRQDALQAVVGPDGGAMPGVSLVALELADSSAAGAGPLGMYALGLAGAYEALGYHGRIEWNPGRSALQTLELTGLQSTPSPSRALRRRVAARGKTLERPKERFL